MGRLGYFLFGTLLGVAGTVATAYLVARSSESELLPENTVDFNATDIDGPKEMATGSNADFVGDEEPIMV